MWFNFTKEEFDTAVMIMELHFRTAEIAKRMKEWKEEQEEKAEAYVLAAQEYTAGGDQVVVDSDAAVSFPEKEEENGAWVQTWIWIDKDDASHFDHTEGD